MTDNSSSRIPIVVISDGLPAYSNWNNWDRPDVAKHFKNPAFKACGFKFSLPLNVYEGKTVRVFGLSRKGKASELNYNKGAQWFASPKKTPAETPPQQASPAPKYSGPSYTLTVTEEGPAITSSDGSTVEVKDDAIQGWLGAARDEGRFIRLAGWAARVESGRPAATIVVFCGGKSVYVGPPNQSRPDVAEHFSIPELLHSGYMFRLPLENLKYKGIRVFAVSDGGKASELRYHKSVQAFLKH